MGKIVIHIKQHTYPRDKDIEQLIAYISGHGKHHKQKVYYRNAYGVSTSYQKAPHQMIQVQKYYKKNSKRRMYHDYIFPERLQIQSHLCNRARGFYRTAIF